MYRLLTEGQVEAGHPEHPPPLPASLGAEAAASVKAQAAGVAAAVPPLMGFPLKVEAMRSAYAAALGREPDFTNNARTVTMRAWLCSRACAGCAVGRLQCLCLKGMLRSAWVMCSCPAGPAQHGLWYLRLLPITTGNVG